MTTVAITGAAGEVGRVAMDAFDDETLRLLTHDTHSDLDSQPLEITDRETFVETLDDVDVLVHLAWGPAPEDSWDESHAANVQGTDNALTAARENALDRVVLASTNHVTGMYNRDDPSEMEHLAPDATTAVHPDDPVRPDSYYGVAKVATEAMGRYYADRYGLEVVVLRIGWLMSREELREVQADHPDRARYARAMWLSPRDCRAIVRGAALEPVDETPLVLNAISHNADRYLSLTETMLHLGYRPKDDAAEVL